jgi:mannose-1-phosphate guanylyltransferase
MKALLLGAGLGTRLRPLTDTVPKCLVPIRGRALLDIWLQSLTDAGIGPFLVNTHHLSATVARHCAASPYADRITIVHEPVLLGTGGTVIANRGFFGREPIFVAHADNYCRCDLRAFAAAHDSRPPGAVMTMMTFRTDTPQTCGIVQLDRRGLVTGFFEKVADPPGNLANGAVYVFEPDVVDFMAALGSPIVDLSTEVIPHFVGRINTWENRGVHRDIGTAESLQAAQACAEVR